jgi:hypothetical protein
MAGLRSDLVTAMAAVQQTWDEAIERYRGLGPDNAFGSQMIGFVEALRGRWEARINVDTSMFDLIFTARGVDKHTMVRVEGRPPTGADLLFVVSLLEDRPRQGLDERGGQLEIAGDICRPENAVNVVDSFLTQIVSG